MDFRKYLDYESNSDDTKEVQDSQEVSKIDKIDAYVEFNNCLATIDKFADKLIQRGLAYKILANNVGIYFELNEKECSKKLKGSYKREFNESLETLFLILENFGMLTESLLTMHDVQVITLPDATQYGMNIGDNLILVNLLNKVGTIGVLVKESVKPPTLQVVSDEYNAGDTLAHLDEYSKMDYTSFDNTIEIEPIPLNLKDFAKLSKKHDNSKNNNNQ